MTTEEEFEMWWREHGRLDHEPRHDQARLAYLAATQRTAQRCVEICANYTDPADGEDSAADTRMTADACAAAIEEQFLP